MCVPGVGGRGDGAVPPRAGHWPASGLSFLICGVGEQQLLPQAEHGETRAECVCGRVPPWCQLWGFMSRSVTSLAFSLPVFFKMRETDWLEDI